MKWMNKGHEFDPLGKIYKNVSKIYFYGACLAAKPLKEQIENTIRQFNNGVLDVQFEFVDKNSDKQNETFLDLNVISPKTFYDIFNKDKEIVVLCMNDKNAVGVWKSLKEHGLDRRINAYNMYEFYRYLSLFMYYRYNKFFLHFLDMFVHTNCNLNCEHCCVHTYRNVRIHRTEDELKKNIDEMFAKIDYIGIMNFGIAEGFLGGKTLEYALQYIINNYSDRFEVIEIVTNGTIVPNEPLLNILKSSKIRVVVDDYTDNVLLAKEKIEKVKECLRKNNVNFSVLKREYWEEYEFGNVVDSNRDMLTQKLTNCICHAKGFAYLGYGQPSTKIYSCVHQTINAYHKIVEEVEDDGIDLIKSSPLEIVEFLLGFTQKGYLSACQNCNGAFEGKEKLHIPVAVQCK
jgi:hypothetical protein